MNNKKQDSPPILALFLAFCCIGAMYGIIALIGLILNV